MMRLRIADLEPDAEIWWLRKSPADRAVLLQAVWEIETGAGGDRRRLTSVPADRLDAPPQTDSDQHGGG